MSTDFTPEVPVHYDVVVLGAGYAGLMAALNLRAALVNVEASFVERVRLQESMIAEVKPRIRSLGDYLRGTGVAFVCAAVTAMDLERRRVEVRYSNGSFGVLGFTQVIYALGSRVDTEEVPGVEQHAFRLDAGDTSRSARGLRAALHRVAQRTLPPPRILAVGGGALSEARRAQRHVPSSTTGLRMRIGALLTRTLP